MIATLRWRYPGGVSASSGETWPFPVSGTVAVGASRGFMMTTAIYAVAGLKCELGMAKILENVYSLSGVTDVAMDLITGGQSPLMVMSGNKLGAEAVRDAVENAGFGLLPPRGPEVGHRGDSSPILDGDPRAEGERMMCSMGGVSS